MRRVLKAWELNLLKQATCPQWKIKDGVDIVFYLC